MNLPLILSKDNDPWPLRHFKRVLLSSLHWLNRLRFLTNRETPHLTGPAVMWLRRYLQTSMKCFEWGSGSSTLFLAKRSFLVVSVEHDMRWHEKVSGWLRSRKLTNAEVFLIPSDPITRRTSPEYYGRILSYPDEFFDLVLVDGRMRLECARNAPAKVRPGGVVLYDDSHREVDVRSIFRGWETIVFSSMISQTSIFLKPGTSPSHGHT